MRPNCCVIEKDKTQKPIIINISKLNLKHLRLQLNSEIFAIHKKPPKDKNYYALTPPKST